MSDEIRITEKELAELLDYSCSLPTGTTIGKRWKRNENFGRANTEPEWWIGEYVEHPDPDTVGIKWTKVAFVVPTCWETG